MSNPIPYPNLERYRDQTSLADKAFTDFHAKNTIIFGELLQKEVDLGLNSWTAPIPSEDLETVIRPRINARIIRRYRMRELITTPIAWWRDQFVESIDDKMEDLGPKYLAILEGARLNLKGTDKEVERTILSQYPQAQLQSPSSDYASTAEEHAKEETGKWSLIELYERYGSFRAPDNELLDHIDKNFSQIWGFSF